MIAIQNKTFGPDFVLASLLAAYPESSFGENVGILLDNTDAGIPELRERLRALLGEPRQLDELRSEYIDLFDRGKQVNSLYETEYGRERALVKGNELVDISGFYRAFGFETGGDGVLAEMIDHVAVELEFYALLVLKSELLEEAADSDGIEVVLDARKKFLKSHLGRFVGAVCERPGVQTSSFYSSVFQYCRDIVGAECARLGVEVEPESWISGSPETSEVTCGGSVGCVK